MFPWLHVLHVHVADGLGIAARCCCAQCTTCGGMAGWPGTGTQHCAHGHGPHLLSSLVLPTKALSPCSSIDTLAFVPAPLEQVGCKGEGVEGCRTRGARRRVSGSVAGGCGEAGEGVAEQAGVCVTCGLQDHRHACSLSKPVRMCTVQCSRLHVGRERVHDCTTPYRRQVAM